MTNPFLPKRQSHEHRVLIESETEGDGYRLTIKSWPADFKLPGQENSVPLTGQTVSSKDISQHPVRAFLATALLALRPGQKIEQFVIPIEPEREDPVWYLVEADFERDSNQKSVILNIENITQPILERRRSAYIGTWHGIIGKSAPMLNVFHRISMYGPTDAPVIITGETGTGKELIARALHETSKRSSKPFVPVNCTALSPELFESELFGHEKGSFTGAVREHKGRFERAHEGTLFLDEIGDMPEMTQAKLLRTLEEGIIERVGSEKEQKVDVRVVAATNVGLERAIMEKHFRSDLYHRLAVLRIHLPALRERRDDIPLLVNYFLGKFNDRYSKNIQRVTPEGLRHLQSYYWPGNIRELRNVMERLVVETSGDAIGIRAIEAWEAEREYFMPGGWNADLTNSQTQRIFVSAPGGMQPANSSHSPYGQPPHGGSWQSSRGIDVPLLANSESSNDSGENRQEISEGNIRQLFQETDGNLTEVARRLGIHKATLYRHMKQLGISRDSLSEDSEAENHE